MSEIPLRYPRYPLPRPRYPGVANTASTDIDIHPDVVPSSDHLCENIQTIYRQTILRFDDSSSNITINLAALHRIRILHLQHRLARQAINYYYRKDGSETVGDPTVSSFNTEESNAHTGSLLHEYTEALRDWDYMKQCAQRRATKDPYVLTTKCQPDFDIIKDNLHRFDEELNHELDSGTSEPRIFGDYSNRRLPTRPAWKTAILGSRKNEGRKLHQDMLIQRMAMAVIGGSFVVGPMLLMVLVDNKTATLATTCLSVLAFGMLIGVYLDRPFDVLSGTAAYAAVLVVFVGASLERGSAK